MTTRGPAVRPFQVTSVNGYNIVQFGPRYVHPPATDRELVLSIYHRTTGGDISVLITPDQVGVLARWFTGEEPVVHHTGGHPPLGAQPDGSFQEPTIYFREFAVLPSVWTIRDLQTSAEAEMLENDRCAVRLWWHGSGRGRSAELSAEDRRAISGFLTKFERGGWATTGVTFG
jgi:hypothetical protein